MNRLFIVEGIPGSGKTTFARKLAAQFSKCNPNVNLYVEGDLHPADMAWCALLTNKEYKEICDSYPWYVQELEHNKTVWDGYIIVAYTKIQNLDSKLYNYFESKEVYDGRIDIETFCAVHENRWKKFGQQATGINVFECALLQNAVNELLLFRCSDETALSKYICKLISCVEKLKPVIIYLNVDTKSAMKRAAMERVDQDGNHVWESRVIEYVTESPYGIENGFIGVEGMYNYFEKRKQIELKILEKLAVEKYCISIDIDNQNEIVGEFIEKIWCSSIKADQIKRIRGD